MALFRRLYQIPPERIYVFDCCFSTDVHDEDKHKSYRGSIVAQLQDYYPDASFKVFNFRKGTKRSQISDILSHYDMPVMKRIIHFLRTCDSWLSQQNVLLMHCERGGLPVLAFMLAGLLLYRKLYNGEQETLEMVYKQAPRELLHLLSPPQPSHLRYLQYISRRNNIGSDWPPSDSPLALDCIFLIVVPLFDGGRGCRPLLRVYGQDPSSTTSNRSSKLLFTTSRTKKHSRLYPPEECAIVKIDIHRRVQGDIVFECVLLGGDDFAREEIMFRIMFHTAFIRSNVLRFTRDEIDVLGDARDLLPRNFTVEVLVSHDDAAPYISTSDVASEDETENERASPEECSEVEEKFSNARGAPDGKGDIDTHSVQESSQDSENEEVGWKEELDHHSLEDCASDGGSQRRDLRVDSNRNGLRTRVMENDESHNAKPKSGGTGNYGTLEEDENNPEREGAAALKKIDRQGSEPKVAAG